jgi:predicted metal-dependent hydrolase
VKIEIEGFWFEWVISSHQEFRVLESSDSVIRLQVPADVDESLVRNYILLNMDSLTKKDIKKSLAAPQSIDLFGTSYFIYIEHGLSQPYIKGSRIYTSKKLLPSSVAQLKKQLLLTHVTTQIGLWEEKLDVLLGDITIKRLRTNWYSINSKTKNLTFSTHLADRNHPQINYLMLKCLLDSTDLENDAKKILMARHIPNYHSLAEELAYEQSKFNS